MTTPKTPQAPRPNIRDSGNGTSSNTGLGGLRPNSTGGTGNGGKK